MQQFPQHAREMHKGEEDQTDALLQAAFGGHQEAKLVKALRKSGHIAGETVLPMGDRIIGYYALSKMDAPKGWLCLAPVAIAPQFQGRYFATRMLRILTEWARLSQTPIVVLGKVSFYERAGFSAKNAQNLTSPYPISHTLLAGTATDQPKATLTYPKAFAALD